MQPKKPAIATAQNCPLCNQPAQCAYQANPKATHCWCMDVEFPASLAPDRENTPINAQCICAQCLKIINARASSPGFTEGDENNSG